MGDLLFYIGLIFKELKSQCVYIIDFFPVCKNIWIAQTKLIKGEEFRRYNASKRGCFHGFKADAATLHVITTGDGTPIEFMVTAGIVHNNTTFQSMDINQPKNSNLYGDTAYISKEHKLFYEKFNGIWLKTVTKKN